MLQITILTNLGQTPNGLLRNHASEDYCHRYITELAGVYLN